MAPRAASAKAISGRFESRMKAQQDGAGGQRNGHESSREQRGKGLAYREPETRLAHPVIDRIADQDIPADEGHLPRLDDGQTAGEARQRARQDRAAFKRAREEPERQDEEGEGFDLLDVLNPPDRRAAERGAERRHDRAARMPALVAEKHQHRAAGKGQ